MFKEGDKTLKAREAILIEQRDKQLEKMKEIQASLDRLNHKIELYQSGMMTEAKKKERMKQNQDN